MKKLIEFELYDGGMEVKLEITEDKKNAVIERILEYCKEYNCTSGEHLQQNDDCLIEASQVLSEIIDDILKFETNWK